MITVVPDGCPGHDGGKDDAARSLIDEIVREGARRDFVLALGQFLGSAAGLSAAVITRLTETWKAEQRAFAARDLSGVDGWRCVNAPHLVALVRAGAVFRDGALIERPEPAAA